MIGQASLINLMSMSPNKVAFLIFNLIIASTSSGLLGEGKMSEGSNLDYYVSDNILGTVIFFARFSV